MIANVMIITLIHACMYINRGWSMCVLSRTLLFGHTSEELVSPRDYRVLVHACVLVCARACVRVSGYVRANVSACVCMCVCGCVFVRGSVRHVNV